VNSQISKDRNYDIPVEAFGRLHSCSEAGSARDRLCRGVKLKAPKARLSFVWLGWYTFEFLKGTVSVLEHQGRVSTSALARPGPVRQPVSGLCHSVTLAYDTKLERCPRPSARPQVGVGFAPRNLSFDKTLSIAHAYM
jgi:hypothetical protein